MIILLRSKCVRSTSQATLGKSLPFPLCLVGFYLVGLSPSRRNILVSVIRKYLNSRSVPSSHPSTPCQRDLFRPERQMAVFENFSSL